MSSDSDDDNVIRYGTPLEPYEEEEIPSKRKFQQQTDQYAVDDHGRRRFHGAFTGGFSAGFQNSVGTAEGWKPSTFKSSRSEKAQRSSQRPEDYMDEEDRSEFGIAPRQMQTHSEFSGQKRPRQNRFHDGPIPGEPVLNEVLQAVHETAAVRMLRAMGWRPGQGAGERLSRAQKRQASDQHRVYGCYAPPHVRQNQDSQQSDEDSSGSEYDFDTLFAPDDYEPYVLARKSDRFGLGYSGLSRHSVLGNLVGEYGSEGGSSSRLVMKDKGKRVSIRGQAFGVGAFEAEDEDIYASEDMSHYDFAIGAPAPAPEQHKHGKATSGVLAGFVRASKPLPPVALHPAPALPRHYTPAPAAARRSRFEPSAAPQRDQGLGRHELTPQARGALLGEIAPQPVEDVKESTTQNTQPITQNTQPNTQNTQPNIQITQSSTQNTQPPTQNTQPPTDPIAKLVGRNINFITTNIEPPKELDFISIKDSGKSIDNVFRPFASNPLKQARYEKFLEDREGFESEREAATDRLSEWERNREMMEFEQAAKLYRPLTGEMGDRFTRASQPDDAVNPLTAVAKSESDYGLATAEMRAAAERGLYGAMTRRRADWRPVPLLCKRFNVPEPGRLTTAEPQKEDRPKVSYSIFSYLETSVHDKESFAKQQTIFGGSKTLNEVKKIPENIQKKPDPNLNEDKGQNRSLIAKDTDVIPSTSETNRFGKRLTVAELFLKESEKDLKEKSQGVTETIEKFDKMDLYKSIFLSDSEEEEVPVSAEPTKINFDDLVDVPKNVERNTSPPRGIFANVNFDEINSWRRIAEDKKTEKVSDKDSSKNINAGTAQNVYGPKIPENLQRRIENEPKAEDFRPIFRSQSQVDKVHEISSSSSDSWVEAKDVKSKKVKKKKTKKHKSKHKKSKHKKKER